MVRRARTIATALALALVGTASPAGAFVSPAWTAARTRRSVLGRWRVVSVRAGGTGAPLGIADPGAPEVVLDFGPTTIRTLAAGGAASQPTLVYSIVGEDDDTLELAVRIGGVPWSVEILRETPTAMTMWISLPLAEVDAPEVEWAMRLERAE